MNLNNKQKIYLTNIFIIDWDDTLFPTSWVNENNINLQDDKSVSEYKLYFIDLDKILSSFLESFSAKGDIFIVSNASLLWIRSCLNILPLTSKIVIINKIRLVSARDLYSTIVNTSTEWKILTFQDVINDNLNKIKKIRPNTYLNILSIGDAKYEYIALLNLNEYLLENNMIKEYKKKDNFNFLLKSVKFIEKPKFEYLIDQIKVFDKNQDLIINTLEYIDLKFD